MAQKVKNEVTTLQVDREVYAALLERKGELERKTGRVASFNDTLRQLVGLKAR